MSEVDDDFLSEYEMRRLLQVCRTTVWRRRGEAGLPHYWAAGRLWYSRKEVERWIEAQERDDADRSQDA